MPKYNVILNLPGLTVQKVDGYDPILFTVVYRRRVACPHCKSHSLRKKDTFFREVAHEMLGERRTRLRIKAHKFYCRDCHRYFNQRFPGILTHQRATERLKEQVCRRHSDGVCQKALARLFKIGKATAERWYHHVYTLKDRRSFNRHCPRLLGIDEHRFSKGVFATTFCDLRKHRVVDLVKGRSQPALHDYLTRLIGRERVQVVCMDLSPSYKSLVQKYFPNAKIVTDRFHVIRQLHHHCLQLYHQIDPKLKYHRGLLAALRTNPERLTSKRQSRRDLYLKQQPAIAAVYHFQQHLYQLLMKKHRTARQCRRLTPIFLRMIRQLKQSAFKPMQTLGKTLYRWREEIVRMWRFTKSNGITEGFHRKMKLIQRRAYGFRSFENYRLRVRVLCS